MHSLSLDDFKNKLSINFEDSFFKEEIRCDFTVTEIQKRIWAVELDLVSKLLEVCKKHNIKIFVFAGTLLGVIRHKGFIPWDDDFDVVVYRDDFEKLQEVAPSEFEEPYFFQSALTDQQYFFGYGRLRNSLTTGHILRQKSLNYNHGIYIDIYVCDGLIDNEFLLHRQCKKKRRLEFLLSSYTKDSFSTNLLKQISKKYINYFMHATFCNIIKYETVIKWYKDALTKYNEDSKEVSILTHELSIIKRMKFDKTEFENIIFLPFENIQVPVPKNYNSILKKMYGNYMEFPPVEKRGVWHDGVIEFNPDISYKEFMNNK